MLAEYYVGNRTRLYEKLTAGSIVAVFSGENTWKTGDEDYMFFADRNFVYLTGLKTSRQAILLAAKEADGSVHEQVYILPSDAYAERWTGARVKPQEAQEISGISDIRFVDALRHWLSADVTRNCILICTVLQQIVQIVLHTVY